MNREELRDKTHKAINKLFDQLEELDSKKDGLSQKAKEEYAEMRLKLAKKKVELEAKLKELEDSSDEKIEELKIAIDKSTIVAKDAFEKIKSHFKK